MRIGEVADELGINTKTIRYYESIGLIPPAARTPTGYRDFTDDDVDRLEFIRTAQRLGLSLEEIRQILELREGGEQPCDYVVQAMRRQADNIDRRIRELTSLRDELDQLLQRAETANARGSSGEAARYCRLLEDSNATTTGHDRLHRRARG